MADVSKLYSVAVVLHRCYNSRVDVNAVLRSLRKAELITEDDLSELSSLEETESAYGPIFNRMGQLDDWVEKFKSACMDKDFPGDDIGKNLLCELADSYDETVERLLGVWNEMDSCKNALIRLSREMWPDKSSLIEQGKKRCPWQLYLVSICSAKENKEKALVFVDTALRFLERSTSNKTRQEQIRWHFRLIIHPSTPDNWDVFVRVTGSGVHFPATKYTFSAMRECYVADIEMSDAVESISYNIYYRTSGGISKSLYYGTEKAVRKYQIGKDEACRGHVILYDVVNTEGGTNDNGWTENLRSEMKKFLPRPRYLNTKSTEDEIPLAWELDGWVNQIQVGWILASDFSSQDSILRSIKLEIPPMMDPSLRYWAAQLRNFPADECDKCWNVKRRIIGLILLLGLTQRRHVVEDLETFVEIFKCLSIHEIDGLEQNSLYKELMTEHCFLNDDVPTPSAVFQTLFKRLKFKLMTEWILALPLYWLLVKNGVFPIQFAEETALRWPLAELPRIEECDWREVKLKASNDISQLSLMNMLNIVADTAKVHPWIVRPYLDMMRGKNILHLISDRPIGAQFLPPVIVIAKLLWSVRQKEADLSLDDLEKRSNYIFSFLRKLATELDYQSTTYESAKVIASEALDCAKTCEYWPGILWCTDVIFAAIDWTKPRHTDTVFSELIELLKRQIEKSAPSEFSKKTVKGTLEAWNRLTFIFWRFEQNQRRWSDELKLALRKKLDEKWTNDSNEDFLRIYLETKEKMTLSPLLQEMMDQKCHDCIEYVLNNSKPVKRATQNLTRFLGGINHELYSELDKIFENIFTKAMGRRLQKDADVALKFILTWKPAVVFYQKFYTKRLKTPNIKFVTFSFRECLDKIKKSKVQMKHLKIIVEHKEVAIELKAAIEKESSVDYDKNVKHLLESAEKSYQRINRINKVLKNLKILLEFLNNQSGLPVKADCITEVVPADISLCSLDALTIPLGFITDEMIEEFEWLSKLMESQVFFTCWKNSGKHVDTDLVEKAPKGLKGTLDMALDVWRRTKDEMHSLFLQLLSGELELRFLHMWFDKKAADFVCEQLKKLYWHGNKMMPEASTTISENQVDHIANQVNEYMKLRKCKSAIDVVLMIKDALSITGDYTVFEKLQKMMDFGNKPMMNIPKHAIDFLTELEEILVCTPQLTQFILETEFIKWIQKNIAGADGITDMGDLALTTEEEMITDIVNCFTNAVTGFSPLIFDIRGQKLSFDKLCVKIHKVHGNIRLNPFLVEQWSESASRKALFEEIEYRMGSLEKNCLATAKSINENGVYKVKSPTQIPESPDEVLQVTLLHHGTEKTMTFSEVEELQASLTLVTEQDAKSKQIISTFSALFSAMENVSKALVSLLRERCMLFFDFTIDVSPSSHSKFIISTSFCDEAPITGTYDVSYVENLAEILENTKHKWMEYVNDKRNHHYCLNEYSIDQISYLCNKLGLLLTDQELPDQALSLLSFVTSLNHPSKMKEILENLDEQRQTSISELHLNMEATGAEETSDCAKAKRCLQAVRDMVHHEQDVTDEQAKAAVISTLDGEDESAEEWLLLNRNDEDLVAEKSREFDERMAFLTPGPAELPTISYSFDGQRLNLTELLSYLQRGPCDPLSSVRTVCDNFIDRTKTMTLTDFISIEHLGAFLDEARNVCPAESLNRTLPSDSFKAGRPNLIVCSENNVYSNILKLYLRNSNDPLPTKSEVLICSDYTSIDEVERFMRRAVGKCGNKGKPLFCLAFCDRLQFNVMKAVDEKFNELKNNKEDAEYQLVILCCDRKSYLAMTFENFEVTWISDVENDDVLRHLEAKLKASVNYDTSPASLYEDRSLVKIVVSGESGNGKSLYVRRQRERLSELKVMPRITTIRCLQDTMDYTAAASKLVSDSPTISYTDPNFIHIDISTAVKNGIDEFVFNLIILGSLQNDAGLLWKRHENHLYLIEITDKNVFEGTARSRSNGLLDFFPKVKAFAPTEVLERNCTDEGDFIGMDKEEFLSETFQRPYQYLKKHRERVCLDSFFYSTPFGTPEDCLRVLLSNFPGKPPSWAQLKCFASFLNVQLRSCEKSEYCNPESGLGRHLRGLKSFVVKFMIRMSQDFATPTTVLSDESGDSSGNGEEIQVGDTSKERRKWEDSIHPYIFFNDDHQTMTFLNVNLTLSGHLIDDEGRIIEENITTGRLVQALSLNLGTGTLKAVSEGPTENWGPAIFSVKLEDRPRMLQILCQVMGVRDVFDPDSSYELTADNVQKILAIYMRFRCQIPVVLLGETGCGKTRMVEFISSFLRRARSSKLNESREIRENMIVRKVYGGITALDIYDSVKKARNVLKKIEDEETEAHQDESKNSFGVILFYDEANTTEAIFAIKEVMCDSTVDGEDSFCDEPLYIVAACNPYKKLSEAAIARLETSGLGFQIHVGQKNQRVSQEMRYLVYKVVQMPASMKQYIWDFGHVNTATEEQYVGQMVQRLETDAKDHLSYLISKMQAFMRAQDVECRFVSLRDVERCIAVYEWFFDRKASLFPLIEAARKIRYRELGRRLPDLPDDVRALLHSIGVCYYYSLQDREAFRKHLCGHLYERSLVATDFDDSDILEEFLAAHSAFLNDIVVGETVFRNQALMENFFMMAVCADTKIPLFVVGKPGSSKSLAKTILSGNMQGNLSRTELFKHLKQVRLLSYQCSAQSEATGIRSVFNKCALLQEGQDPKKYAAVVVLDELGLAEHSPNMPLKILHPLLESGTTSGRLTNVDQKKKVGFVGISNWCLDPAKLNRGIFILREEPDEDDLLKTSRHISSLPSDIRKGVTKAYMKIYRGQGGKNDREMFGLRDFYSLIKMIPAEADLDDGRRISMAIYRNFDKESTLTPGDSNEIVFRENLPCPLVSRSTFTVGDFIEENLKETETRFLLLVSNNYPSINLLPQFIEGFAENAVVIFGSSFPGDHNHAEVCRNINAIKVCMDTGRLVILLNMADVHESLYDALNQHFVILGGKRYVDLGLGAQRVKCHVAPKFRMIILEQKDTALKVYPIPLLSRLEKHSLNARDLLKPEERTKIQQLENWIESLFRGNKFRENDALMGYHDDLLSSALLICERDVTKCKESLFQCATMDSIFRLPPAGSTQSLRDTYQKDNTHSHLLNLLQATISSYSGKRFIRMFEILTFSHVLLKNDRVAIEEKLNLSGSVMVLNLEEFQTRRQFQDKIELFLGRSNVNVGILVIQCSKAEEYGELMECAKHEWETKAKMLDEEEMKHSIIAIFLWSLERNGNSLENAVRSASARRFVMQFSDTYEIAYVDEVSLSGETVPPSNWLFRNTRQESFTSDTERAIRFVKGCLSSSVGRIHTHHTFRLLKLLTTLCEETTDAANGFRSILLKKVASRLARLDNSDANGETWFTREARNHESLQEGGTFQKALILSLKNAISGSLIELISNISRFGNLELLLECHKEEQKPWKTNMWLEMFDQSDAKDFKISNVDLHREKDRVTCGTPFFFRITGHCEELWNEVAEKYPGKVWKPFIKQFRRAGFCKILADATRSSKVVSAMKEFARDLIIVHCPSGTNHVEATLSEILYQVAWKRRSILTKEQPSDFEDGDEFPLVYATFKEIEVSDMSQILTTCPRISPQAHTWIDKQDAFGPCKLHILALQDCFGVLHKDTQSFAEPLACREWQKLSANLKTIILPMLDKMGTEDEKAELMRSWMSFCQIDLLLLNLIPRKNEERPEEQDRYESLIGPEAKLVLKGVHKKQIEDFKQVRIFSSLLETCYNKVKLNIEVSWGTTICKRCRRTLKSPWVLPCKHVVCYECYKFLVDNKKKCPQCQNPIDETARAVELTKEGESELALFKARCTAFFLQYLKEIVFGPVSNICKSQWAKEWVKSLLSVIVQSKGQKPNILTGGIELDLNTKASILGILLENCHEQAVADIDGCFKMDNEDDKKSFVEVALYYCEQQLAREHSPATLKRNEFRIQLLREGAEYMQENKTKLQCLDTMRSIAHIRSGIKYFVGEIQPLMEKESDKLEEVRTLFRRLSSCAEEDTIRKFFMKCGWLLFGPLWCFSVIKCKEFLPIELDDVKENMCYDFWAVFGRHYLNAKGALRAEPTKETRQTEEEEIRQTIDDLARKGNPIHALAIIGSLPNIEEDLKTYAEEKIDSVDFGDGKLRVASCSRSITEALSKVNEIRQPEVFILHRVLLATAVVVADVNYLLEEFFEIANRPDAVSFLSPSEFLRSPEKNTSERSLVLQIILNACVVLGMIRNADAVRKMLPGDVSEDQLPIMLLNSLKMSLRNLASALEMKIYDAALLVHIVLRRIMSDDKKPETKFSRTTTEERLRWEQEFEQKYLNAIFGDLHLRISGAKQTIEEDFFKTDFHRFVHGTSQLSSEKFSLKSETLWNYTKNISLEDFRGRLENSGPREGIALKLLFQFDQLHLTKYLEAVLTLHNNLILKCKKFGKPKTMVDADPITVGEFVSDYEENKRLVEKYIELWNLIATHAFTTKSAASKLPTLIQPIDMKSPLSMILPSSRGRGKSAKLLVEYLASIHNEFLKKCEENGISQTSLEPLPVHRLRHSHYIDFDLHKDLLPLLQLNTIYHEPGENVIKPSLFYNIEAVEKWVREKFVNYKRQILMTDLPCMDYFRDTELASAWQKVKEKYKPEKLPTSLATEADDVASRLTTTCSVVRILAHAIGYMATEKVELNEKLSDFLANKLQLSATEIHGIPNRARVRHTLSLYLRFSWQRSRMFVARNANPFAKFLDKNLQEHISEVFVVDSLMKSLQHTKIKLIQQMLNEVIVCGLDFSPESSIIDDIFPSYEFVWLGGDGFDFDLPCDIRFKHIRHLFEIAVDYENGHKSVRIRHNTNQTEDSFTEGPQTNLDVPEYCTDVEHFGPDGGIMELKGKDCRPTLILQPNALEDITEIQIGQIIDSGIWPESHVAVCPVLVCRPSGLNFSNPVIIQVGTWSDIGNSEKAIQLFRQDEGGNWIRQDTEVTRLREFEYQFQAAHFTRFFLGYLLEAVSNFLCPVQHRIKTWICQNTTGRFCNIVCLDNDALVESIEERLQNERYTPTFPLPLTFVAYSGDNITVQLQSPDPVVRIRNQRGYSIKIDREFLTKLQQPNYFSVTLDGDIDQSTRLEMTYILSKNGEVTENPFSYLLNA